METALNVFIDKLLTTSAKRQASNIHLTVSSYPALRINDELIELADEEVITDSFIRKLADGWLNDEQKKTLEEEREIVLTKEIGKKFRVKINFFFQKEFLSASLRLIPNQAPPLINLGLPKSVYSLTEKTSGLIIIAGPYGSGRTTTMAAMIEEINKTRKQSIVTIEKPIEFIFSNKKSLILQREVGRDTNSFMDALEYAQQSDVDVCGIGVTTEAGVLPLVLEFANSGRLAFLNMETTSVIQTIEEILANFPADEKERARLLLSESLVAIIVQRLLPKIGGGMVLASEVLIETPSVKSLIREGKIKQIATVLQSSREEGMTSLDQSLSALVKSGEVLIDQAIKEADDPDNFRAMAKS
ncbi:PilT/PilU family type 4a pilus ATPase [Candidatus Falkowbacteria bacterium]|nr:PilT/PilU family type 4a pilus ATPase [Candidatus Falkowbacteria bacterium]